MRKRKNKKLNKEISKILEVAKDMPEKYHKLPGEDFDINKSEVIKWLLDQEEIKQAIKQRIYNLVSNGKSIVYDKESKKWVGKNHVKSTESSEIENLSDFNNENE